MLYKEETDTDNEEINDMYKILPDDNHKSFPEKHITDIKISPVSSEDLRE